METECDDMLVSSFNSYKTDKITWLEAIHGSNILNSQNPIFAIRGQYGTLCTKDRGVFKVTNDYVICDGFIIATPIN